ALAHFNITIAAPVGNINASQFLQVNDPPGLTHLRLTKCQSNCSTAISSIQQCGDTNDACLCSNATVQAIVQCEQCMFNELIALNRPPMDPRAGQTAAIAAYAAACQGSLTDDQILPGNASQFMVLNPKLVALTPPPFNGPFEQILTTFGTAVSVIAATLLGSGLIAVVNTM
ncbi:hypothetical protein FKP32DRAFT_1578179, partial [Trametes sanguinea]